MSNGSSLFSNTPLQQRLIEGGGVKGEIGELRRDLAPLSAVVALTVDKFVLPITASATALKIATATVTEEVVLTASDLTALTLANMADNARYLVFTTAGATGAHAPASVLIRGTAADGKKRSETLALSQTSGASVTTLTAFMSIDSITYPPADGTAATVAIGITAALGLGKAMAVTQSLTYVLRELVAGAVVTNGVFVSGTPTAAAVTGTAVLTTGGTLATEAFTFAVDGEDPETVTFATPANVAAVITAINAVHAGLASNDGSDHIVLTSPTTGTSSSVEIIASTALTKLGLTAGMNIGRDQLSGKYTPSSAPNGARSYAVYYEFDPTV